MDGGNGKCLRAQWPRRCFGSGLGTSVRCWSWRLTSALWVLEEAKSLRSARVEDEMVSTRVSQGQIRAGKALSCIYRSRTSHKRPTGGSPRRVRTAAAQRFGGFLPLRFSLEGIRALTSWGLQTNNSLCRPATAWIIFLVQSILAVKSWVCVMSPHLGK